MLKENGNLLCYWTAVCKSHQGFELWIVLIFQLGAFKLCCMCEISFWIKVSEKMLAFDIIIIIFIYCNWVVTRWQWLFYMYTKLEIGYY